MSDSDEHDCHHPSDKEDDVYSDEIAVVIEKSISTDDSIQDLRLSQKDREKDYGNGWTESVQDRFEKLLHSCKTKCEMHNEASSYFNRWYRYITYPNIVLSTALTILTTYNTSAYNPDIVYYIAGISGVNSVIASLSGFWEYSERSASHRNTALQYSDLTRQITTELFLPIDERNAVKYDFDVFSLLLQNIEGSEPAIPKFIKRKRKKIKINP